jgi:G:T-mismatch repair DNA endonuclease (very short patch repair protein)
MKKDTIYHLNYWLKRGLNEDEAKIKIEIVKKETSWRCKEFWIKRGYNELESLMMISSKQKEISLKRDRNKKQKNPYSEEYYIENGINNPDEIKELIQKRKNKSNPYIVCSEDKINNMIKKRNITYYGKTEEERKKINISRGLNKEDIIKKFGIEKSLEIFRNRGKGSRSPYEKKYSKMSLSLFEMIKDMNPEKEFFYGKNEKFIPIKHEGKRKGYFVDFLFEDEKKIIEFNGDFWHYNPKKYLSESFTILMGKKIKAQDVWDEDEKKINLLKQKGYEVLIIWEMDFKENENEIKIICNNFINKK